MSKPDVFDCHICGKIFFITDDNISHHAGLDDMIDYDADADHCPFTLDNIQTNKQYELRSSDGVLKAIIPERIASDIMLESNGTWRSVEYAEGTVKQFLIKFDDADSIGWPFGDENEQLTLLFVDGDTIDIVK